MKTTLPTVTAAAALLILAPHLHADPAGTAFTYQGRLTEAGAPAEGLYDLQFTLFDGATGGIIAARPLIFPGVAVTGGVFTVALDFGSAPFAGDARWLEIGVRRSESGDDFTTLSPRQIIAPAPYAVYAVNAGTAATAGTVGAGSLGTALLGTNASGFEWVTNITSYTGINFSNLTISGASTNPANGTYVATALITDPSHPPTSAQFVWRNSNGWMIQQDTSLQLALAPYAVVRPGPETYEDRVIYGGYGDWTNGCLALDDYGGHAPAPYGLIVAQRTTNYSRYLVLRADEEPAGMVVSGVSGITVGGAITAATLSGDGSGVSNVVPASYQRVLASLDDSRMAQGAVFKDIFATPPMGICTWPGFGWSVNEPIVRMLADGLYTNHLVELGWRLIQIDGGWQAREAGYTGGRGADGKLHWSSNFPNPTSTINYLADRGIGLGLYHEMDGGNEGMHLVGHLPQDVASFKEWGVVYLKLDGGDMTLDGRFAQLSDLRQAMDMADWRAFILNGWYYMPPTTPYPEVRSPLVADAWRLCVDGDLYINEDPPLGLLLLLNHFHHGMLSMTNCAGPGKYMDFDFLNIAGLFGVAAPQNRTNLVQTALSLWAIGPSCLMIDMVSDGIVPFISNRAMIAIHQDPLCLPGGATAQGADMEIWTRSMVNGDRAVCVVNKTSSPISPAITLDSLGLPAGPNLYKKVYSVWDKHVVSYTTNSFAVTVPAYSANLLRVSK